MSLSSREIIQETLKSLESMLIARDFRIEDPELETEELHWKGWLRGPWWRNDIVRCSWSKQDVDRILVHLVTELLIDEEKWTMDGTTVDYVSGRSSGAYFLPGRLTLALRGVRPFVRRVVKDTEKALAWFHEFETPEACIRRLESGSANFAAPGSQVSNTVVGHLHNLSAHGREG